MRRNEQVRKRGSPPLFVRERGQAALPDLFFFLHAFGFLAATITMMCKTG
jgi:hypothetical protein